MLKSADTASAWPMPRMTFSISSAMAAMIRSFRNKLMGFLGLRRRLAGLAVSRFAIGRGGRAVAGLLREQRANEEPLSFVQNSHGGAELAPVFRLLGGRHFCCGS